MYLERLNIFGWEEIEPSLLVSLAIKRPVLLIGECGTNKSEGVRRIAESLRLSFCRYDASKAVFEDVIGFPNPQKLSNGHLDYVPTPLTIWDKEFVLIDEINRAPLQMQNKWFEVIHEHTLMGQPTKIKHVWSAMNPSSTDYMGTNDLDRALVDRYALFIKVPDIYTMNEESARNIIKKGDKSSSNTILKDLFKEVDGLPKPSTKMEETLVKFAKILKYEHRQAISGRRLVLLSEILGGISKVQKVCNGLEVNLANILANAVYDLDTTVTSQIWQTLLGGREDVVDLMSSDVYERVGIILNAEEETTKRSQALGWVLDYLKDCSEEEKYVYLRILSTVKEDSLQPMIWQTFVNETFRLSEERIEKIKGIAKNIAKKLGYA